MEINSFCPDCGNGIFLTELPKAGLIQCTRCPSGREVKGQGALGPTGAIETCALCGGTEFYRQKDFNTKLGLWIVAAIIILALVFNRWLVQILVAGALLDLGLFFFLGEIVVCYSCRAIYRGLPVNPQVGGFDLKVHDKYVFKGKKP